MKFRFASLLAAAAVMGIAAAPANAQQRVFFGIATGGTGGTYYPLGGMLAQVISNNATVAGKNAAEVVNDTARSFRLFAEQTGSDLKALAACIRGPREKITPEQLLNIKAPTLLAVGTEDVIAGSGAELAALIPGAELLNIEGRDHMKAVGDAGFKQGVLDFLTKRA